MLNDTNEKIKRYVDFIDSTTRYDTKDVYALYYPRCRKLVKNLNCKGGTVIHIVYPKDFKNHTYD